MDSQYISDIKYLCSTDSVMVFFHFSRRRVLLHVDTIDPVMLPSYGDVPLFAEQHKM